MTKTADNFSPKTLEDLDQLRPMLPVDLGAELSIGDTVWRVQGACSQGWMLCKGNSGRGAWQTNGDSLWGDWCDDDCLHLDGDGRGIITADGEVVA